MIEITKKEDCSGCYACSNKCPKNCISMETDEEGFWYPKVNEKLCINCGLCEKVCPIIHKSKINNNPLAYACYNNDENVRRSSSSGGIFSIIADCILNDNGVIFGAGFDTEFSVVHSYIKKEEDVALFRGSKYVQSKIGITFKEVEGFLNQGIPVLFSGTPCQIAGLKSYLGIEYENLICVDFICHGVPSPMVFQKYRLEFEKHFGSTIKEIAFRRKDFGWKLFSLSFTFNNGKEYIKPLSNDIFIQGFLKDLYLRPSCYACNFKTLNRQSDITLADFWGVEEVLPEFNDDKGTSLIIVNSEKGKHIFESLQDKMTVRDVDIQKAIKYNISAIKSVMQNPNTHKFFAKCITHSGNISVLINKYIRPPAFERIRTIIFMPLSKIKRALKKIIK